MLPLFSLSIAASAQEPSADYRIGPGDVLSLEVFGEELGTVVMVDEAGRVTLVCGRVEVAGVTAIDAAHAAEECFRTGWLVDPKVQVNVKEFRSQKVEVLGQVAKAGVYYLERPTTLREILSKAGWVQVDKGNGVAVVREPTGERHDVPLSDIEGPGGSLLLRGGWVVSIDPGQSVFVGGEVVKEGPVGYVTGLTAYQALMTGGGPTPLANLARSYVLRDGEKMPINLRRVRKGKDADLELRPGDQVVVPESPL